MTMCNHMMAAKHQTTFKCTHTHTLSICSAVLEVQNKPPLNYITVTKAEICLPMLVELSMQNNASKEKNCYVIHFYKIDLMEVLIDCSTLWKLDQIFEVQHRCVSQKRYGLNSNVHGCDMITGKWLNLCEALLQLSSYFPITKRGLAYVIVFILERFMFDGIRFHIRLKTETTTCDLDITKVWHSRECWLMHIFFFNL